MEKKGQFAGSHRWQIHVATPLKTNIAQTWVWKMIYFCKLTCSSCFLKSAAIIMTIHRDTCQQKSFPDLLVPRLKPVWALKCPQCKLLDVNKCSLSLPRTKFTKRFLGSSEFRGTGRLTKDLAELKLELGKTTFPEGWTIWRDWNIYWISMCVFLRFLKHVVDVCSSSGDIPNLAVPKSADVVEMQCFRGCYAFPFPCASHIFRLHSPDFPSWVSPPRRFGKIVCNVVAFYFVQRFQQPKLGKH